MLQETSTFPPGVWSVLGIAVSATGASLTGFGAEGNHAEDLKEKIDEHLDEAFEKVEEQMKTKDKLDDSLRQRVLQMMSYVVIRRNVDNTVAPKEKWLRGLAIFLVGVAAVVAGFFAWMNSQQGGVPTSAETILNYAVVLALILFACSVWMHQSLHRTVEKYKKAIKREDPGRLS